MSLKFCANLSFMFNEVGTLIERYGAASRAGFKAVECAFPYEFPVKDVVKAKEDAGLEQVLINIHVGDVTKGDLGTAAIPGKQSEFQKSLNLAIEYANALKCKRLHIMSGAVKDATEENWNTYEKNIRYAVNELEKHNIVGLIEPINNWTVPNYFMNSYEKALNLVKSVNSSSLKIMMDIFHLQRLKGNLTLNIEELLNYVGHIQIAQVPNRNEPDTPGEINFQYLFSVLEKNKYDKWIGLEYKPALNDSVAGLKWIKNYGYEL